MRKLLWISGREDWCINNLNSLIEDLPNQAKEIIYCGSDNQALDRHQINLNTSSKRAQIEHYLGTECGILIVNTFDGFNPELFCALCGTVKSPGLIFLITPLAKQWPIYRDPECSKLCSFPYTVKDIKGRFIEYFIHKLRSCRHSGSIISIAENSSTHAQCRHIKSELQQLYLNWVSDKSRKLILTERHEQIISWIANILSGSQSGILILSGGRGRGKSSVLGIALDAFANNCSRQVNVCVVSQTRSNILPILRQVTDDEIAIFNYQITRSPLSIIYRPPDEFLKTKQETDLLIVDEAASIPLPQLLRMLEDYPKIILSTTTDGYEGTGMGFTAKLEKQLLKNKNPVTRIRLRQSLRWCENDPVENLLHDSLLHDHREISVIDNPASQISISDLKFEKLDRNELASSTEIIDQIYALLSLAHYRTTPDDLRFMLDAPGIELWIARYKKTIYAAMMVGREGGLPEEFHEDIWLGIRRFRGHLIPQCIAAQCGFASACGYNYRRILRIAVSKPYQKIGIGKNLVKSALKYQASIHQLDYFGVSFGFENRLFEFWKKLNFSPVKLGYRKNARSGSRSLIMLKPGSVRAAELLCRLHLRMRNEIKFMSTLHPASVKSHYSSLYQTLDHSDREVDCDRQDKLDIYSFAFGNRQLAHCHWVLSKYAKLSIKNSKISDSLTAAQSNLLSLKILKNESWKICADLLGYTGKKQTLTELRAVFAIIYSATWGNKS